MAYSEAEFTREEVMGSDTTKETTPEGAPENGVPVPETKEKKTKASYATHGIFSRSPWKALSKLGEDMKKLGQTERMLYERFRPRDPFEEFVLDRAWASVLRCILIGREEERIFATGGKSDIERIEGLAHSSVKCVPSKVIADQTPSGLLNELASVLRYDSYYAREFLRWIGILEALQNGEHQGPVFNISRKLGNSRVEEN